MGDDVYLPGLLHELDLVASAGEGRRMIDQGGVKVEGEALQPHIYNYARALLDGRIVQVGKRRFARPVARD
jgi:tyrosyl-tRNA synthetase